VVGTARWRLEEIPIHRFQHLSNEHRPRLIPHEPHARPCSFLRFPVERKSNSSIRRGRNTAAVVRRNIKRTENTRRLCPRDHETSRKLRPCVRLCGSRKRARSARGSQLADMGSRNPSESENGAERGGGAAKKAARKAIETREGGENSSERPSTRRPSF